jgi:hypothetical protein
MTTDSPKPKPSFLDRFQKLGANLFLGFLVTALSVFTAFTNYATYNVSGIASGYESEGTRLLADSNTEYVRATQFIIVDYDMYDGFYIQQGVDDFAAEYYQANFSKELQGSVDRDNAFDEQYYEEMYTYSNDLFDQAFEKFDQANVEYEREASYQLAMLIAAVGLAFAAYASLLAEQNRMRPLFALMSLFMFVLSILQYSAA